MEQNITGGCILLSRQIMKSEIWKKPPEYLKIFLYILLKVNHKDDLFPRGSNFFNFSEERPTGVTKNQIYDFLRWAKSEKIGILTTQKTTRGIVVKVNNYNRYQTLGNYQLQDRFQNSSKIAPEQLQNSSNTINKNERMKECNNLSLSNDGVNQKRLGKREREILKSYCKRIKVKNANAYIRTLIDNGDYQTILEEENIRLEKIKAKEQEVLNTKIEVKPEIPQNLDFSKATNIVQMIRRRG